MLRDCFACFLVGTGPFLACFFDCERAIPTDVPAASRQHHTHARTHHSIGETDGNGSAVAVAAKACCCKRLAVHRPTTYAVSIGFVCVCGLCLLFVCVLSHTMRWLSGWLPSDRELLARHDGQDPWLTLRQNTQGVQGALGAFCVRASSSIMCCVCVCVRLCVVSVCVPLVLVGEMRKEEQCPVL